MVHWKRNRRWTILWGVMIGSMLGCGDTPNTTPDAPTYAPLVSLSDQQEKQKSQALEAKTVLFQSLLGELGKLIGERGPAESVDVCKTRAPEIANKVGQDAGVRIGRTSFKLRNQANGPPGWSARFVKEKVEQEVAVELADGETGFLLPIRLQASCLICHGTDDQIVPQIKSAIEANYPDDEATGFSEGDLRGYFWIEVPRLSTD